MKKAVILLSGGLDSATCLAIALNQGFECYAISFNYGQKQVCELHAATNIAAAFNISHKIINLTSLGEIARSALTSTELNIPDYQNNNEIPITYVPARNTVFLSIALSYAESLGAECIFIGASAIDYSGYPDCRPEYFVQFQKLINLATKAGVEGQTIQIQTPLAHLSKSETILTGLKLGVDYTKTITCYRANAQGEACGSCDSCHLRKKGFQEAGVEDPTKYSHLS
jgi:7-cyano-7-deazaguanine synthase